MRRTAHSEFLTLDSVYLKPADQAFVSEAQLREQWSALNYLSKPDLELAKKEYERFEKLLSNHGVKVHKFSRNDSVMIDSIYCRDASIVTDYGVILCNMGKGARLNEPKAQKEVFIQDGLSIFGQIKAPGTVEGGDVAWLDKKTLAVGHSYRTNYPGIEQLKALLEPKGIEVIVVELPHYKGVNDVFHLMSILSPVARDLAVVYSPLMPINFRNLLMERGFDFVEVPDDEFDSMACNVLAIAPKVCVMVEGNPKTKNRLLEKGCKVHTYKGKHISVLGGGGPTCLTRPIIRLEDIDNDQ